MWPIMDPYVSNHPLTRDRMEAVKAALDASPYTNQPLDPELERQYRRMIAKIYAFLKPQIATFQKYPEKRQERRRRATPAPSLIIAAASSTRPSRW